MATKTKPDPDRLLTKPEAAEALQVSERTLHTMLKTKVLKATKVPPHTGKRPRVFVKQSDLDAYMARRLTAAGRS